MNHPEPTVLYVDNHTVAVDKPAGLLVQADRTGDPCLLDWVRGWIEQEYDKPGRAFVGLVHRLDRPVSGVVVFARTSKGASRLSAQIREGHWDKEYLALVERCPQPVEGDLRQHLRWDGERARVGRKGREVRLEYQALGRRGGRWLLLLRLHTGRKHQIRAQLSALGCPLIGDRRYGSTAELGDRRIGLCAWRLGYDHPTRDQRIVVTAALPDWAAPFRDFLPA